MKITSLDVIHKFDFGGVRVGLNDDMEVRAAYREIKQFVLNRNPEARIKEILVEEMAGKGEEVILEVSNDPQFWSHPDVRFGRHLCGSSGGCDFPPGSCDRAFRPAHDNRHPHL